MDTQRVTPNTVLHQTTNTLRYLVAGKLGCEVNFYSVIVRFQFPFPALFQAKCLIQIINQFFLSENGIYKFLADSIPKIIDFGLKST